MHSALQDHLLALFQRGLFDAFIRYGLAALALCALLSWISARINSRNRRRPSKARRQRPRPRQVPLQTPTPPLSTVPVTSRRPLTAFEEQMYLALTAALPECVVLAQVAFSALVTTEDRAHRNRFDRKVADFVICSKQMTPFAIIELDDRSHLGREAADAQRDALMLNAGYHTLRYPGIPPVEQIRHDVEALLVMLTAPPQPATELHYL